MWRRWRPPTVVSCPARHRRSTREAPRLPFPAAPGSSSAAGPQCSRVHSSGSPSVRPSAAGHLPAGGCVVSANHLSGFDAWALAYALQSRRVRYMGKNALFRRPPAGSSCGAWVSFRRVPRGHCAAASSSPPSSPGRRDGRDLPRGRPPPRHRQEAAARGRASRARDRRPARPGRDRRDGRMAPADPLAGGRRWVGRRRRSSWGAR